MNSNDLLSRQQAAIASSEAYAAVKNISRDTRLGRNALLAGFVIPYAECCRWVATMIPNAARPHDPHIFDSLITAYLNDRFADLTDDYNAFPFRAVANPSGPHNAMYVLETRFGFGKWNNELGAYNIDEVFDERLRITLNDNTVREALRFLQEEMKLVEIGLPTTYYSVIV
ncbi:hypothetical protein MSAN_01140500 [Mycena sanguinolenta]|uniref:Uncharacterized protein n=1 Tax=Mycena sanguinolenta TaxID=230812 RepID=A0A8H7D6X8_9AGAR|nr:hypothetical protein MSAN_01140500 [Mycena sanguinolenta]